MISEVNVEQKGHVNDARKDGEWQTILGMWRVSEYDVGELETGRAAQAQPQRVENEVIVRGVHKRANHEHHAVAEQRVALCFSDCRVTKLYRLYKIAIV